jgi:hypothetical protein
MSELQSASPVTRSVTEQELRDLHFNKPKRYYILLTQAERMIIARSVWDKHLNDHLDKHGQVGVIVYNEIYEPCSKCRDARVAIAKRKYDFFHRDEINYGRDSDDYWCNSCQGTTWQIVPTADLVEPLNILTVEAKLRSLSPAEFNQILMTPVYALKWPYYEGVVKAEALRRLELSNNEKPKSD